MFEEKDIINAVLKPPQKSDEWEVEARPGGRYLHTVSRADTIPTSTLPVVDR